MLASYDEDTDTFTSICKVGTGFTDILFSGHAFENFGNNLEGTDQLSWELFLNGSSTPVDFGGPPAGSDFTSFDISLADPGGATVSQIRVAFTVTNFNAGQEWFATRGSLRATYSAIPEPSAVPFILLLFVFGESVVFRSAR